MLRSQMVADSSSYPFYQKQLTTRHFTYHIIQYIFLALIFESSYTVTVRILHTVATDNSQLVIIRKFFSVIYEESTDLTQKLKQLITLLNVIFWSFCVLVLCNPSRTSTSSARQVSLSPSASLIRVLFQVVDTPETLENVTIRPEIQK